MELNKRIDSMRDEIIKSTQEIVRIKSVEGEPKEGMPFGEGCAKSLDYALKIADKLGFRTVNLDGYVGYAEYGEGEEYVAALGHLDVVPEGEGWIYPPYGAEIHDDKIYGRGTSDDKGPIIAALYGLKAVKDEGLALSKRIRIIFGTNEETGSNDLPYYLEREKAPAAGFTPDAEYPIINGEKGLTGFRMVREFNKRCEGDIVIKEIKGGQASNIVPDYCKSVLVAKDCDAVIKAVDKFAEESGYELSAEVKEDLVYIYSKGAPAHASLLEQGKNAVMQLFAFLGTLNLGSNDVSNFVCFMNKYIGMNVHGEAFGCFLEDEVSGKLSFNLGIIEMNEEKVEFVLDVRYPVTCKLEDMKTPFEKTIEGTGIEIAHFSHHEPLYFEPKHPLIKALQKVYEEQTGNKADLVSIGGGTYAKSMPNIVAFGPEFPGEPDTIHKANEYIKIDNLIINAKIYAHALYELAK
jgi:succinyl-diaminopimelate desuccinylase